MIGNLVATTGPDDRSNATPALGITKKRLAGEIHKLCHRRPHDLRVRINMVRNIVAARFRTCLRGLAARCARVFDWVHPRKERVQGMPGARCTRGPVRNEVGSCAHEHTGEAEASGIPCVMALRLMPCSPRRRIRLVTVAGGLKALRPRLGSQHLRRLDTSNGCQDHTVLPYAQTPVVLRACHRSRGSTRPATAPARRRSRVHHIPSRVRDDARPPLLPERDGRN